MSTTVRKRVKKKGTTIPNRFVPKFWDECDHRYAVVRRIKKRVEELIRDAGCDSIQKKLLAERAIFLALQLETAEINAAMKSGQFDAGVYTQAVNTLSGLLTKLGLELKPEEKESLTDYVGDEE